MTDELVEARSELRRALIALGKTAQRLDTASVLEWSARGGPSPWVRPDDEWAELGRAVMLRSGRRRV